MEWAQHATHFVSTKDPLASLVPNCLELPALYGRALVASTLQDSISRLVEPCIDKVCTVVDQQILDQVKMHSEKYGNDVNGRLACYDVECEREVEQEQAEITAGTCTHFTIDS